jgi:hypothetical protein
VSERPGSAAALRAVAVAFAALCGALVPLAADARTMYRYVNEQGVRVVAYQVPPEYVAGGYEVLNEKGVVVEVVPPVPKESERESLAASREAAERARAEAEALREWDESLLLRYSSVTDIEAARDRALRELQIRVSILRGKQRALRQQVEGYQASAADQERRGQAVSELNLQAMRDLRDEIEATERAIAEREQEITAVEASFQRDIERFETLADLVRLRRQLNAGPATVQPEGDGRPPDSVEH